MPGRSRSQGIVSERRGHLPVWIKNKNFSGHAAVAFVVERNAISADQSGNEFKMQIGKQREGLGPIGANGFLALEFTRGLTGDLRDDR